MPVAIGKQINEVISVAKQTVSNTLETCDIHHNKTFIKDSLRSALNRLLISLLSIMDDPWGSQKLLEHWIIQMIPTTRSSTTIVAAMVQNAAVMKPIAKFVAETVEKKIDKSVKNLVRTTPLPLLFGLDLLPETR